MCSPLRSDVHAAYIVPPLAVLFDLLLWRCPSALSLRVRTTYFRNTRLRSRNQRSTANNPHTPPRPGSLVQMGAGYTNTHLLHLAPSNLERKMNDGLRISTTLKQAFASRLCLLSTSIRAPDSKPSVYGTHCAARELRRTSPSSTTKRLQNHYPIEIKRYSQKQPRHPLLF